MDGYQRVVITHPGKGIYLGTYSGRDFWSTVNAGGESTASVFESEENARSFVLGLFPKLDDYQLYQYIEIETKNNRYATIDELSHFGLDEYLSQMRENEATNLIEDEESG